ncbi:MAG: trypsin-like peptidase domain-containing protein [Lentisphaeria bacterium]|nr:trypsin-like peptidase domain-containing protein [Lentisphaeria bacterium]
MPSVINISTERVVRVADPFESFFNNFFAPHFRTLTESIPLGSGILVDDTGLALTNYHVIQRASSVLVRLWNGEVHGASVVAYDVDNDLCLLSLELEPDAAPLQAVGFALPDDLYLGETVVAVGNPFGLEHSVAQGVLSARNRSLREGDVVFNDILQTDAAINPGNSGGPLINLDGDLIGINLAIRRDAEGIGFAIPLRRIEGVLSRWLAPRCFSDGYCGFFTETVVDAEGVRATVAEVWEDSPAARAGLKPGDVVLECADRKVSRAVDVGRILFRLRPGETLRLKLADGRRLTLPIELMPAEVLIRRRLGVRVQPLTQALRQALGLPDDLKGLAISEVYPESDFEKRRGRWGDMVRRGDVIVQLDGVQTPTVEAMQEALKGRHSGAKAALVLVAVDTIRNRLRLSPIRIDVMLN